MTNRSMKIALYLLILLLLALQYPLWFGNGSVIARWKLKQEIAAQHAENASLRTHNRALEAEVADLKQGLESAEARARAELGMIKKDESFYQIIENQNRRDTPAKEMPGRPARP